MTRDGDVCMPRKPITRPWSWVQGKCRFASCSGDASRPGEANPVNSGEPRLTPLELSACSPGRPTACNSGRLRGSGRMTQRRNLI